MDGHEPVPRLHLGVAQTVRFARQMMVLIVGVLALWGIVPAVANAEAKPEWERGGEPIGRSKEILWKGTVGIIDQTHEYGKINVKCHDTGKGWVRPKSVGEETSWTFSNCTVAFNQGDCREGKPLSIEAQNLPWHTELVAVEGKVRDVIATSGKGVPHFKMECFDEGVDKTVTDVCPVANTTLTNTEVGVTETFENKSITCSLGYAGSARFEGAENSEALELVEGGLLSVS